MSKRVKVDAHFRITEPSFWIRLDELIKQMNLNSKPENFYRDPLNQFITSKLLSLDEDLYKPLKDTTKSHGFSEGTFTRLQGRREHEPKVKEWNTSGDLVDVLCYFIHERRYYQCVIDKLLPLGDTDDFYKLRSGRMKKISFEEFKAQFAPHSENIVNSPEVNQPEITEKEVKENTETEKDLVDISSKSLENDVWVHEEGNVATTEEDDLTPQEKEKLKKEFIDAIEDMKKIREVYDKEYAELEAREQVLLKRIAEKNKKK